MYLNELDHYVKEDLRIKCYIRYVDDFVILSNSRKELEEHWQMIGYFLKFRLSIDLHSEKTHIIDLKNGVGFLGFRVFYYHKLLKKSNMKKFRTRLERTCRHFDEKRIEYDNVYDFLEGWIAYSMDADTYNLRNKLLGPLYCKFSGEISTKEYSRHLRHINFD